MKTVVVVQEHNEGQPDKPWLTLRKIGEEMEMDDARAEKLVAFGLVKYKPVPEPKAEPEKEKKGGKQ